MVTQAPVTYVAKSTVDLDDDAAFEVLEVPPNPTKPVRGGRRHHHRWQPMCAQNPLNEANLKQAFAAIGDHPKGQQDRGSMPHGSAGGQLGHHGIDGGNAPLDCPGDHGDRIVGARDLVVVFRTASDIAVERQAKVRRGIVPADRLPGPHRRGDLA